jgi:hypothetical protein
MDGKKQIQKGNHQWKTRLSLSVAAVNVLFTIRVIGKPLIYRQIELTVLMYVGLGQLFQVVTFVCKHEQVC